MKILHLAPYSPVPPTFGAALRMYHMLRGLAQRHEVTLVTLGTERDLYALKSSFGETLDSIHIVRPNSLLHKHPWFRILAALRRNESFYTQYTNGSRLQSVLDRLYENSRFDFTIIEFPHMGKFRFGAETICIMDEHNVEYSNFERMYKGIRSPARRLLYYREYRKTHLEELEACRKMDAIFTTSLHDSRILDREVPEKPKFVIPNGVDTGYFVPTMAEPEPYSMVFTGTMDYVPNQDGVMYFLDRIFPLIRRVIPESKFYIVGKNPPQAIKNRASRNVIVTGYVDDVRPYTWKASVFVVPLRMGSGTRLKILEGLAMKKAIVTTSIGCEGIEVKNGVDLVVADGAASFAAEVVELLLNRGKALSLGERGHELVKSRYDWSVVIAKMDYALMSLYGERHSIRAQKVNKVQVKQDNRSRELEPQENSDAQPSIKVLMYHRVVGDDVHPDQYSWNVTVSQLRRQLELLGKWGYTCINFEDYALAKQGILSLPKKPVIMTFDDGYDEVYRNALPVMKEFGARATAFVLGDRSIKSNTWDVQNGFEGAGLMDEDQILELRDAGFEIGSHSMTHLDLTSIPEQNTWRELAESKDILENLINAPVISFAYPFGAANIRIERLVQKAGYDFGCGVYSGPPKFLHDKYNIRRIPITRKTNAIDFALKILTPYEYYEWIRWETGQMLHGNRVGVGVQSGTNDRDVRNIEVDSNE